jgi:hypothetical protein
MTNQLTVVLTLDVDTLALFREMNERLKRIEGMEIKIMADIDDILSDVQAETNAEQAAIVLLQSLSAALKAAGNDPVKVAAVRALIQSNTAAMAAAVVANTPAASAPASGSGSGPTVIPNPLAISNGSSVQLAVDNAAGTDITSSASYASSDVTTVSVTPSGLATGNKVGTAVLTVTDANGNATTVPVNVS